MVEERIVVLNEHNKQEHPPMHTAEHILNQTMVRLFGCPRSKNTHIAKKKSNCDYFLDSLPTVEQIAQIESEVNRVISSNLEVTVSFISLSEAEGLVDLSKLPENVSDTLRIVKVGDYDTCACIGAHVNNTSEIGEFKILSHDYADGRWRVRWKVTK